MIFKGVVECATHDEEVSCSHFQHTVLYPETSLACTHVDNFKIIVAVRAHVSADATRQIAHIDWKGGVERPDMDPVSADCGRQDAPVVLIAFSGTMKWRH